MDVAMLRRVIEKEIKNVIPTRIGNDEITEISKESVENLIWCLERFYEKACNRWARVLADIASSLPMVRLEKAVKERIDHESVDASILGSIVKTYSELYSSIVGGVIDGDTVLIEVKHPIASPEGVIIWPGAIVSLGIREAVGLSIGGFTRIITPAVLTSTLSSDHELR